ncbi:hypothetical protein [Paracoccus niistensis]|uniref:Plasmid mobilization relaxosome protein MobC n=1 Tax=Paracoccus niistensis TaxID=632935 RepID=A0ABV6I151_9RHOB
MSARESVTFRLTKEQREQLDRLVAASGQTQNSYILSCVLSSGGGRTFADVERRLGEVGFLLNAVIEQLLQNKWPDSKKAITSLMRQYDRLVDRVILGLNIDALDR